MPPNTYEKEKKPMANSKNMIRIRLKAHDENNECREGDIVRVMETRPLSRDKRWRVVEIVEKAK